MTQTATIENRKTYELEPWDGSLVPEEVFPPFPDLIRQEQCFRDRRFADAADRVQGKDQVDARIRKQADVGPVVHRVRRVAMRQAVPRQGKNLMPGMLAPAQGA